MVLQIEPTSHTTNGQKYIIYRHLNYKINASPSHQILSEKLIPTPLECSTCHKNTLQSPADSSCPVLSTQHRIHSHVRITIVIDIVGNGFRSNGLSPYIAPGIFTSHRRLRRLEIPKIQASPGSPKIFNLGLIPNPVFPTSPTLFSTVVFDGSLQHYKNPSQGTAGELRMSHCEFLFLPPNSNSNFRHLPANPAVTSLPCRSTQTPFTPQIPDKTPYKPRPTTAAKFFGRSYPLALNP
ncbi:uncharacterized protein RJT20DRAFT_17041 [Scheffersomyces xylosifermentans]|uniref:uncharacterized protein n=1 Tax=Scheffersomyces xylosifermentans TaxID=1304137 RepID=UPI00315DF326